MSSVYPSWNEESLAIPPRSYLYSLKPERVGTPYVERLTSYISRLSASHLVFPGALLKKVASGLIPKKYSSARLNKIYLHTAAINGTGVMALDLVRVFETLTLQPNLQSLTLLPLAQVLPTRNLLHRHQVWCPFCYEDCLTNQISVYEPLLWSLQEVKMCRIHNFPLQNKCPYCGQENFLLAWQAEPGYCSKCYKWLGIPFNNKVDKNEFIGIENQNWELWVVASIGDMISFAFQHQDSLKLQNIISSLNICINHFTQGNVAHFARQIQIPKNSLWLWCQGKHLPSLQAILRICYLTKVSLVDFYSGKLSFDQSLQQLSPISLPHMPSNRKTSSLDLNQVQQYLEHTLATGESPPPSLEEVARRLQCHRRTIYRKFPQLCHQISVKYIRYRQETFRAELEKTYQQIKDTVERLSQEGYYPSEKLVAQFIDHPGYLRYKKVRATLRNAQNSVIFK